MDGEATAASTAGRQATFLGHPRGLGVLFFAEMWERFSFYGMKALLIFYLTQHFGFDDRQGLLVLSAYASLVYATPIIGGLLADRYLGLRKSVVAGAVLLTLGHLGMAFEGEVATVAADGSVARDETALQILYLSLALIILGVGFLKPNISAIVGRLYDINDRRRDAGFTIYYMGINIGAFAAPIICGYLGQHPDYGWSWGFGAAGIGMALGLFVFVRWQHLLEGVAEPESPEWLREKKAGLSRETLIYLAVIPAVAVVAFFMQFEEAVGNTVVGALVVVFSFLIWYAFKRLEPVDRDRMFALLILMFVSVLFWALFDQGGGSLNLFADRNVDLGPLGFDLTASQLQSVNPLFVGLFAGPLAALWLWLGSRGWEPAAPVKFAMALVQIGAAFLILYLGTLQAGPDGIVGLHWLVLGYLFITTGELCLSPVGLSATTKLSLPSLVGVMMGAWFLSTAAAQYLAGLIGGLAAVPTTPGEDIDPMVSLPIYGELFWKAGIFAVAAGLLFWLVTPFVKRLMHNIR